MPPKWKIIDDTMLKARLFVKTNINMPFHQHDDTDETHSLYPSGEWEGFFTYAFGPGAERHPMHFILRFKNNAVTGSGGDEVGPFHWRGLYDKEQLRCQMTKYYTSHTVFYDGQVDENGIWGTWNIRGYFSGGFHIWPKNSGENNAEAETVQETVQETITIKVS